MRYSNSSFNLIPKSCSAASSPFSQILSQVFGLTIRIVAGHRIIFAQLFNEEFDGQRQKLTAEIDRSNSPMNILCRGTTRPRTYQLHAVFYILYRQGGQGNTRMCVYSSDSWASWHIMIALLRVLAQVVFRVDMKNALVVE